MSEEMKLKPCPFCGGTDVLIKSDGAYKWSECANMKCRAEGKCFMFLHDAGNAATIVANNWNTRPIEDQLRAQLAEAQAKVERYEGAIREFGAVDSCYERFNDRYNSAYDAILDLAHSLPPKEG